jgi:hypothetical protein
MRWLVLVLLGTALAPTATGWGAPSAVPSKLLGTWTDDFFNALKIKANGRVQYVIGGAERIDGTVSGTRTRTTFGPTPACAGKGVYSWTLKGRRLTFKVISDRCVTRRNFVRKTWTRT